MRLLLHTLHFAAEDPRLGTRASAIAHWLAARGHALSIVAAEDRRHPTSDGKGGQLRVLRCPMMASHSHGRLARGVRNVSFAVASAPSLIAEAASFAPDIVGALAPSAAAASAALAAARLAGRPAWLHIEEDAPALGIEPGFDFVSAAAYDADERLKDRGVASDCGLALAPWVDTGVIGASDDPGPWRGRLAVAADDVIALYVGSAADPAIVETLIDASRRVPARGAIRFVVAARGPLWPQLAAAARALPRLAVCTLPRAYELAPLLAAADIHLMPEGIGACEPMIAAKLATLLASGRPIVAGRNTAALPPQLVDAIVPAWPDGEGLADAVVLLAAVSAERRARGVAARRAAEDYFAKERMLRRLEQRLVALAATS